MDAKKLAAFNIKKLIPKTLISDTDGVLILKKHKEDFKIAMGNCQDNNTWRALLPQWVDKNFVLASFISLADSHEQWFDYAIKRAEGHLDSRFTTFFQELVSKSVVIETPGKHLESSKQIFTQLVDSIELSSAHVHLKDALKELKPILVEKLQNDFVCSLATRALLNTYPAIKLEPKREKAVEIAMWLQEQADARSKSEQKSFGVRLSYTNTLGSNFGALITQKESRAEKSPKNPKPPTPKFAPKNPHKSQGESRFEKMLREKNEKEKFEKKEAQKKTAKKAQREAAETEAKKNLKKKKFFDKDDRSNKKQKFSYYEVVNSVTTSDNSTFSLMANPDQFQLTGKRSESHSDSLDLANTGKMELDGINQQIETNSSKAEEISIEKPMIDSEAIPGGGKRVTFKALTPLNEEIIILLDSQSSTTLISEERAISCGYQLIKSKIPVRMEGLLGSEVTTPKYCLVTIKFIDKANKVLDLAMPAYLVKSIPGKADLLVGMDQMGPGKVIGLNIPRKLNENISISIGKSNSKEEVTFELYPHESEGVFVNKPTSVSTQLNSSLNDTGGSALQESKLDMDIDEKEVNNVIDDEGHTSTPEGKEEENVPTELISLPFVKLNGNEPKYLIPKLVDLNMVNGEITKVQKMLEDITKKILEINDSLDQGAKYSHGRKSSLKEQRTYLKSVKRKESEHILYLIKVRDILSKEIKRDVTIIQNRKMRQKRKLSEKEIVEKIKSIPRYLSSDLSKTFDSKNKSAREIAMSILDELKNEPNGKIKTTCEVASTWSAQNLTASSSIWKMLKEEMKEEIITIINASMTSEVNDDSKVAEWRDGSLENVEEKFFDENVTLFHQLSGALNSKFQELRVDYSDVLVPNDNDIPMGQATLEGEQIEFDAINLVPGGMERLLKKRKKPYPTKKPERELLDNTIADMEKVGVGELDPKDFETQIASPAFFVFQKGKKRFCVDYRDVNAETLEFVYPIPNIDSILESMLGKKFFSVIDLKSGYHQFRLSQRAMRLAANITTAGIFKYNVLTFGLKNAPAFFQKTMNMIFKDLIGICMFVYIDDIIIFSENAEQHLLDIKKVLDRLRKSNLKANVNKCHFFASQIKCLGKIITSEGIAPDPDLIAAMVNFPVPKTKTKVRSFLGLVGHYMHFIEDFQAKAQPLRELTLDKVNFSEAWDDEIHLPLFNELKQCMLRAPILAYPDYTKPFFIQADASKFGAGGILFQLDENDRQRIVGYASWILDKAQRGYHTSEREFLALVKCVKKWKSFFWGRKISIESDHQALKGVLNVGDPYGRIARWFALLSQFDYEVKYIKGVDNVSADVMSRTYGDLADTTEVAELEAKCHCMKHEITSAFLQYNGPTDDQYYAAQRQDLEILKYIMYLESNLLPNDNKEALKIAKDSVNFMMKNRLIYRKRKNPGTDIITSVLWIPDSMRKDVLIEMHDQIWQGAHMGRDKTIDKIKKKYYFRNIPKFVDLWIRTCSICNRTKRRHPRNHQTKLGQVPVTKPWDLLCIDIWEPGCKSNLGREYVLTVVDAFTKYAWAIPLVDEKSKTIAVALLEHVICKFPQGTRIHSDRGENFISEIMHHLYEMCNLEKSETSAYHPQSNTYAERIHQFFKNAITSYVNRNQRDWDIVLALVLRCYLDAKHESLDGLSPSELVFGRPIGSEMSIPVEFKSNKEFVHRLNSALLGAQKAVLEQVDKRRSKKPIAEVRHKSNLKVGDLVGIKVRKIPAHFDSNKLYIRYKGPFTISRITQEGRVIRVIDPISGEEDPTPISNTEVKKFNSRKGTALSESSSREESYELSSGIEDLSSVDDYHLSDDTEDGSESGVISRKTRSMTTTKETTSLAKSAKKVVQEPAKGHRNIMDLKKADANPIEIPKGYKNLLGVKISFEDQTREELALFIHTYS